MRFAVVIRQRLVDRRITAKKNTRQHHLDFAFRSAIEDGIASMVAGDRKLADRARRA